MELQRRVHQGEIVLRVVVDRFIETPIPVSHHDLLEAKFVGSSIPGFSAGLVVPSPF